MKNWILIVLIITLPVVSNAQDMDQLFTGDSLENSTVHKTEKPKIKTGVDVNMGYMVAGNGYNGPVMSISPHLTYPISDKFWINTGISAGFGSTYAPGMNFEYQQMIPMKQLFVYAQGNYRLNNRMVVNGAVYKNVSEIMVPKNNTLQNQAYTYQGVSLGMNYKITKNISFGAQIHLNSPSGSNLYSPNRLGSPFYSPYGF